VQRHKCILRGVYLCCHLKRVARKEYVDLSECGALARALKAYTVTTFNFQVGITAFIVAGVVYAIHAQVVYDLITVYIIGREGDVVVGAFP